MARKKPFNARPFAYRQEIEIEIETLTNLGSGLGRVRIPDDPDPGPGRWVVLVPFALPGERVRAAVHRNHANYSEADLLQVLTASPDRTEPACPLFGRCGGCQYQNLKYASQLGWKRRQVEELLQRMAGLSFPVDPVVPSPRAAGYRSKITPHFNRPRPEQPPAIGFLRQGTRFDIVDVERCPIATGPINARLAEVRAGVFAGAARGDYERGSTLLLRDAGGLVTTDWDAAVVETVAVPGRSRPLELRFLARDFFQNNPFILPAFVAHVRDEAAAGGARFLVDAYCGSGLFALGAADAFQQVAGIEISASAVLAARRNAEANGISNAAFTAGDASAIFAGLAFPAAETAVVIDPPRKGCDEPFIRQLLAYGPRTVVYVSCDPATQMRDLTHFLAAGYTPRRVQPFDLFPQTRHLECVITLGRPPAFLQGGSPRCHGVENPVG